MADAPVVANQSAPNPPFQCKQCLATYTRQDHLHRHEATHDQVKTGVCCFCSARFHRKDILRRHYKNCKERGDRPIPQVQTRGRRRQACDRCSSHKLACDPGQPCRSCAGQNHVCSRSHGQAAPRTDVADTIAVAPAEQTTVPEVHLPVPALEQLSTSLQGVTSPVSPALTPPDAGIRHSKFVLSHVPIPFLSAFVSADSSAGLVGVFGYSSVPPEPLDESIVPPVSHPTHSTNPDSYGVPASDSNSPLSNQHLAFFPDAATTFSNFGQNTLSVNNGLSETTQDIPDHNGVGSSSAVFGAFGQHVIPVSANSRSSEMALDMPEPNTLNPVSHKIYELVTQLTNTFITLPKGHYKKMASVKIAQADMFFSPSNVHVFIKTYFHHFHPHFALVHRPSFDIKTASSRLLLAVCLAGSFYSSLSSDLGHGKSLLDLAEEFIFRDTAFKYVAKGIPARQTNGDTVSRLFNLEALQAGFIIVLLQNWEGDKAAQRRARLDRLHELVSLARTLHLTTFKTTWLAAVEPQQSFDWAEFGRQESCVRILYHLFVFDSTLSIFHNYPPRFVMSELNASLPCSQECFEATSSGDCLQSAHIDIDQQPRQTPTLKATLTLLVGEDMAAETKAALVKLTPLHLFILIHTLHHVIWQAQNNIILGLALDEILERALSRWKNLWDWSKRRAPTRSLRRSGFILCAEEYWWLARLKLYEGLADEGTAFEDDQMRGVRQLFERHSEPQGEDHFEFDT